MGDGDHGVVYGRVQHSEAAGELDGDGLGSGVYSTLRSSLFQSTTTWPLPVWKADQLWALAGRLSRATESTWLLAA